MTASSAPGDQLSLAAGRVPSQYPEVAPGSKSFELLRDHVDMQVNDVRGMLLLPRVDTEPGMNLAATAIMLNLLCGFALWFDDEQVRVGQGANRDSFRAFFEAHYPGERIPGSGSLGGVSARLWGLRNLLAHSVGLPGRQGQLRTYSIAKGPMSEAQVVRIELEDGYPFTTNPLRVARRDTHLDIEVPGLYWAFVHMLRHALSVADESWEQRAAEWWEAIPRITGTPAHEGAVGIVTERPSPG